MAEKQPQNYANHAKIVPTYHYFAFSVLLVNLIWSLWKLGRALFSDAYAPNFDLVMGVLMALAFLVMFLYLRLFPLAVQDRVIRQEMRLRLAEILPDDLKGRIDELKRGQFVGLRFASDVEMPELMRDALDNGLKAGEIKKKIKDWQADHLRC
ncbi:MAG: DUF6526 family protein [Acidobacteriota bacterium]